MRTFVRMAVLGASVLVWGVTPATAAAPARVRVNLPADATLTVNGQSTRSTSATRWFVTPPLEDGRNYYYNFVARFVRDGQPVTVEQKVPVRAGRETVVALNGPGSASAAVSNQFYYYTPQTQTAPPAGTNFYFYPGAAGTPSYGGPSVPTSPLGNQWVPGNFQMYNP